MICVYRNEEVNAPKLINVYWHCAYEIIDEILFHPSISMTIEKQFRTVRYVTSLQLIRWQFCIFNFPFSICHFFHFFHLNTERSKVKYFQFISICAGRQLCLRFSYVNLFPFAVNISLLN